LKYDCNKNSCPDGAVIGAPITAEKPDAVESNLPDDHTWQYIWDDGNSVPYLTNQTLNQLISYEDKRSLEAKCQLVNNLGGAIIWRLGQNVYGDANTNICTIGKALLNTECQ
jgi:GH18 family chitinase